MTALSRPLPQGASSPAGTRGPFSRPRAASYEIEKVCPEPLAAVRA
ncbi:hypothetical protein [Streptomyces viridochromogenes]|uniref:Uncharacterized protein n=1 Tax=Streptomyces viridochromogenes Tue57 TaxID=1160705 RepID=L8PL61_STRVR|nr:hypothetical protein [Streptomyces viridochromogenes]ELS56728.1 hypothetical protein STVIR_2299 [Streptomyces viridochromogenes Tue57]